MTTPKDERFQEWKKAVKRSVPSLTMYQVVLLLEIINRAYEEGKTDAQR